MNKSLFPLEIKHNGHEFYIKKKRREGKYKNLKLKIKKREEKPRSRLVQFLFLCLDFVFLFKKKKKNSFLDELFLIKKFQTMFRTNKNKKRVF